MNEQLSLLPFTFRLLARVVLVVKNLLANAGDIRDAGLIPESEDLMEEGTANLSSILAWRIPWTESLAGYSPWGCRELESESDMTEQLSLFSFV